MIGPSEQRGEEPRYASDEGEEKKKKKETKTRSRSGAAGTARPLDLLIGWSGTMRLMGDSSPTFSTDWLQKLNWLMVRFVSMRVKQQQQPIWGIEGRQDGVRLAAGLRRYAWICRPEGKENSYPQRCATEVSRIRPIPLVLVLQSAFRWRGKKGGGIK